VALMFWTQVLHFGPSARTGHAMAYDAARRRVLLFGGVNAEAVLGDTWAWDGTYWMQVAETGPTPRSGHAMAYDGARNQVVLFGGAPVEQGADTWTWDGLAWTQLAETGPSPRFEHAMAYDEGRRVIVLFGGMDPNGELGDTWEWDGTAWTLKETSGPVARRDHAVAYDVTSSRVVLFGGAADDKVFDDTWAWDGALWKQVAEFGPPATHVAAMTGAGRGTMLFGGAGSTTDGTPGRASTWAWDGRFWTEILHFGPPARTQHAIAFDAARHRIVLFGGDRLWRAPNPSSLLGDTWECPAREPTVASVKVSPADVRVGDQVVVTVGLSGPAAGDVVVQLTSRLAGQTNSLELPSTVTVPAGQAAASVTKVVPAGTAPGVYTITAGDSASSQSAIVKVQEVAAPGTLRIAAALPNPEGDESQAEAVHLRNLGPTTVMLAGWRITNGNGQAWGLDNVDGAVSPGQVAIVTRQGRPMALTNTGGTIALINPAGEVLDRKEYGPAASGQLIQLE
jgi:hypothetical protein